MPPRHPLTPARRISRRARRAGLAAVLGLPAMAATIAAAQSAAPATRPLTYSATTARITWTPPATVTEEQRLTLGFSGQVDGQVTSHIALLDAGTACPASPLYPRQIAVGATVTVTPDPAAIPTPTATPAPTTPVATTPDPTAATTPAEPTATPAPAAPAPLGGLVTGQLTVTPRTSGSYHLCGWLLANPATSESSTVARIDQPIAVANRTSPITAEVPDTARSGDYFTVKVTGTAAAAGRRLLIMAEPDRGQQCDTLRKAAAGRRPLQTVVGVPSGPFSKTLKLRYRSRTAGPYLLCIQVVEASDRVPEGSASRVMAVTESLKCVNTQAAIAQRGTDLKVIRGRRDAARQRLSSARKRLVPIRKRYSAARKASERRIAKARRAVSKAKSATGKRRARARLASVRRTEARRIKRARAPYAKANAAVKVRTRTYRQYRTGAALLTDTLARMKKDAKKYCAKPVV